MPSVIIVKMMVRRYAQFAYRRWNVLLAYKCGMHSLLIKIRPVKAEALTVNAFAFTGRFPYINIVLLSTATIQIPFHGL